MQLSDPIQSRFRLSPLQSKALARLHIHTIRDLLYHMPSRYENLSQVRMVRDLKKGDEVIVYGYLKHLKTGKSFKSKMPIAEATLDDGTGTIVVRWFHQPYIAKLFSESSLVKLGGVVTGSEGRLYIANPEVERAPDMPIDRSDTLFMKGAQQGGGDKDTPNISSQETFYAIYPESKGITSKWFRHAIKTALGEIQKEALLDPIPKEILARYHLPTLQSALVWIHLPQKESDSVSARKRFAFEEVFLIQLARAKARKTRADEHALQIRVDRLAIEHFMRERFPFTPTHSQKKAIEAILKDIDPKGLRGGNAPMARLLEGDVGSGKTAVAAAVMYATVTTPPPKNSFASLQVAYMAPTEILARQQFEAFVSYFSHLPISLALITSSGCKKFPSKIDDAQATDISRAQLLRWVAGGDIAIVVGTHSLIQKSVSFQNLGLVIIDEQHRFGTRQRQILARKDDITPHLLSMTATPIPRTLALTIYGDLDLTVLSEMPKGRKEVITKTISPTERKETYERVREELARGRQVYVICPRIDEPDPEKQGAREARSVVAELERLKKIFPEYALDRAHSKLLPKEKERVMGAFAEGKTHILVSTSVVEVGVNVPNATVMIIEGAEHYGLAQLHQLRGRVVRSNHQAYCYCFAESNSKKTRERLKALLTAKNGFELAEADLALRGAGELAGVRQSGLSDIGMEALKNLKMVEAARAEARAMIEKDPDLKELPLLNSLVTEKLSKLHFE